MPEQKPKEIELETCRFSDVEPIWRGELWGGINKVIRPTSSLKFLGGFDVRIHEQADPVFWCARIEGQIVGVNSGHSSGQDTSQTHFRSRGLWVAERYRNRGIASLLLAETENEAKRRAAHLVWSIPRVSSFYVYAKAGFQVVSSPFNEGMSSGPNVYAAKILSSAD